MQLNGFPPTFPIIVLLAVSSGLRAAPHKGSGVPVELADHLLRPGHDQTIPEATTPVATVLPPLQPQELWLQMVKQQHPDLPNPEVHKFKLVSLHELCTETIRSTGRQCRGVVNGDSFECLRCGGRTAAHWYPCPYNHKTGVYVGALAREKDVEEEEVKEIPQTAELNKQEGLEEQEQKD